MDQAVTRAAGATPSTTLAAAAAPRLVGEFQGYVDGIVPSVRWLDRKNMPQVGDRLFAISAHAAAPRSWAILLTSANHGVVGPLGHPFKHAGEHHERVVVVEVPAGAGAPSDEVNLVLRAAPPAQAKTGASTALSNERIEELWDETQTADAETFNEVRRRFARAIEREVAAQAGQVAVPEGWRLVPVESCGKMTKAGEKALRKLLGSTATTFDAYSCYAAMLAAAPSAPVVAQQAPADEYKPVGKFLFTGMAYEATSSDDPRGITLYRPAQASTPGERQEGGAA